MPHQSRTPLWQLTATDLHEAYRSHRILPSDVVEAILERYTQVNPALNLLAFADADGARAAARASDERFRQNAPLGDMDGIPVTIKDNIPVKDMPLAWGSALYTRQIAQQDETPVARLRMQGAVILGKTNVSEFTMGPGNVNTPAFGVTRNPYNPALTPGASTGGGAAATAAGVGVITLGTDGGGSIRRPSSYQNLVGLKPSTGRVARVGGLPPILLDFEVIGPIARTTDDLAMALSAIEGPDPLDRNSYGFQKGRIRKPAPGGRILLVMDIDGQTVEAPIVTSVRAAAQNLADMGFIIEEGPAPCDTAFFARAWPLLGSVGLAWLLRDTPWQGRIGQSYPPMIEAGNALSAVEFFDILLGFQKIYEDMSAALQHYDFIMTPCAGAMPWRAEDAGPAYHRAFTGFVNAAGLPSVAVPGDPSPEGLPVGFQIIGSYGADWDLVSLARAYEERHPWAHRLPGI